MWMIISQLLGHLSYDKNLLKQQWKGSQKLEKKLEYTLAPREAKVHWVLIKEFNTLKDVLATFTQEEVWNSDFTN